MKKHNALLAALLALLGACQIQENKDWNNPLDPKVNGMVLVSGVRFQMGSPVDEPGRDADESLHWVTVSSFLIDPTEVTQKDFQGLMNFNHSDHLRCPTCPVEYVTWYDALRYCNARSRRDGLDTVYAWDSLHLDDNGAGCIGAYGLTVHPERNGYRLPTEAQWERAARGDSLGTAWFWGDDTGRVDAFARRLDSTGPVGTRLPNSLGLYDMAGNVREWTSDRFAPYPKTESVDPLGPDTGATYVLRGGAFTFDGDSSGAVRFLRSANRLESLPTESNRVIGFRCVRPLMR